MKLYPRWGRSRIIEKVSEVIRPQLVRLEEELQEQCGKLSAQETHYTFLARKRRILV